MTKQEAIKIIEVAKAEIEWHYPLNYQCAFDMAIKALKQRQEPLTDQEQRIFLAAMRREEKVCKEANYENILVSICHSIKRKVRKALWG